MSYFQFWTLLAVLVMITEPPAPASRSWGRTIMFCFLVLFALACLPAELAR